MSQRQEQQQAYCHRCETMRLHTRAVPTFPSLAHLIVFATLSVPGFLVWASTPLSPTPDGVDLLVSLIAQLVASVLFFWMFWIPIWFLHVLLHALFERPPPYRCTECGQAMGALTPEQHRVWQEHHLAQWRIAARRRKMRGRTPGQIMSRMWGSVDGLLLAIAGQENVIVHRFLQVLLIGSLTIAMMSAVWWAMWAG